MLEGTAPQVSAESYACDVLTPSRASIQGIESGVGRELAYKLEGGSDRHEASLRVDAVAQETKLLTDAESFR